MSKNDKYIPDSQIVVYYPVEKLLAFRDFTTLF